MVKALCGVLLCIVQCCRARLSVPGYPQDRVDCAACEVIAREIEDKMLTGAHKTDEASRLDILYSACDEMARALPSKLDAVEGLTTEETVQFWKHVSAGDEEQKTMPGMCAVSDNCTICLGASRLERLVAEMGLCVFVRMGPVRMGLVWLLFMSALRTLSA